MQDHPGHFLVYLGPLFSNPGGDLLGCHSAVTVSPDRGSGRAETMSFVTSDVIHHQLVGYFFNMQSLFTRKR